MSKIRKPSERLERRENVQQYIDYLLKLTIPKHREKALHKIYGFEVSYDNSYNNCIKLGGSFEHDYIENDALWAGSVYFILNNIKDAVIHYVHETTKAEYKDLKDLAYEAFVGLDEACDLTEQLRKMALYLVPGEKVIASAIEQLMGRPQTEMAGGFGGVFYYAFQAIKNDADAIADAIINEYEAQQKGGAK